MFTGSPRVTNVRLANDSYLRTGGSVTSAHARPLFWWAENDVCACVATWQNIGKRRLCRSAHALLSYEHIPLKNKPAVPNPFVTQGLYILFTSYTFLFYLFWWCLYILITFHFFTPWLPPILFSTSIPQFFTEHRTPRTCHTITI